MSLRWAAMAGMAALYLACLLLAPAGSLATLEPHVALLSPRLAHPLGTDDLGRDMLAALLQGGRTSLSVALVATVLALAIGLLVGLLAGLGPALLDEVVMRLAEMTAGLPVLLLAVLVAALFGGSALNLALLLGLTRWPVIARIVRMEVRSLLGREFLQAAWALGAPALHVARRHLLPHLIGPALAAAGIVFGGAVVAEAALAFVGLGDPAVTSWGQMVAAGFVMQGLAWWVWLWPAVMLAAVSGLVAVAADFHPRGR